MSERAGTNGAKKSSDTERTWPPSATDDTSVDVVPRTASKSDRGRTVKIGVVMLKCEW